MPTAPPHHIRSFMTQIALNHQLPNQNGPTMTTRSSNLTTSQQNGIPLNSYNTTTSRIILHRQNLRVPITTLAHTRQLPPCFVPLTSIQPRRAIGARRSFRQAGRSRRTRESWDPASVPNVEWVRGAPESTHTAIITSHSAPSSQHPVHQPSSTATVPSRTQS